MHPPWGGKHLIMVTTTGGHSATKIWLRKRDLLSFYCWLAVPTRKVDIYEKAIAVLMGTLSSGTRDQRIGEGAGLLLRYCKQGGQRASASKSEANCGGRSSNLSTEMARSNQCGRKFHRGKEPTQSKPHPVRPFCDEVSMRTRATAGT